MIALTSTSRQLEMDLASASSVALDIVVTFQDIRYADQVKNVGTQLSSSNGVTDVIIATAPTAGVLRLIQSISVCNRDNTATETARIYYDESGTESDIIQVDLSGGDQLYYEDNQGWKVLNSVGSVKSSDSNNSNIGVSLNNFSGDGTTTAFSLTTSPQTENLVWVYIGGVYQFKNGFTISGTTLTFDTAPPTGTTNIEVVYISDVTANVPPSDSVTSAMIVDATIVTGDIAAGGTFTLVTEQATTSGTSITFSDIPSGTKIIIVMLQGVSIATADRVQIRLGDSGGVEATGYTGNIAQIVTAGNPTVESPTIGIGLTLDAQAATMTLSGTLILCLEDSTNHTWNWQWVGIRADALINYVGAGFKDIDTALTTVTLTTTVPSSFDAGAINIMYK